MTHEIHPLITNDATLFGILAAMLGGIFLTSKSERPGDFRCPFQPRKNNKRKQ